MTDQNAKLLSQAPKLRGTAPATSQPGTAVTAASTPAASTSTDPGKRTVRTVGPPFLSLGQMQMQQQQQSQQPQ